jgi:hypothetical protein
MLQVDLFENLSEETQNRILGHEQKAMRLLFSAASVIDKIIGDEAAKAVRRHWPVADRLSKIEGYANGHF